MVDAADFHFSVQGSASAPYRLTAYGAGSQFRMFCDCPAGRKALQMCKHIADLLMGDVTTLVHPSDDVGILANAARGSEILSHALVYFPKARPVEIGLDNDTASGLDSAFATILATAATQGWITRATPTAIGLHKLSRVGKVLKGPEVGLSVTQGTVRPFAVFGRTITTRTFSRAERAAAYFVEMAEKHRPPQARESIAPPPA